jgi:hypothetical protein
MMRVALFFIWFVGVVIGVPMLYVGGLVWHEVATLDAAAPHVALDPAATRSALSAGALLPATDASAAFPGARVATMALYDDGTRVVFVDAGDDVAATAARQHYLTEAGAHLRMSTKLIERFASDSFTTMAGEQGRLVRADGILVIVTGQTDDAVAARVALLRTRADVPVLAWALSAPVGSEMGPLFLQMMVPVLLWTLLAVPWFGRMASWAGARPAVAGAAPVDAATLRQRLLSLGGTLPFSVTPGTRPDELYVDWRYADTRLTPVLQLARRRRVHRIVLRLDDAHRVVRAQDRHATLDWSAGGASAAASLSWRASRRIQFFQYEHESELGIGFDAGRLAISQKSSYTFNLAELKAPVVTTITRSGWEFRPVVSFARLLGG